MIKYKLKQEIVFKSEIELPEGSQAVIVKHHGAYEYKEGGVSMPECWQVTWLEPIVTVKAR